MTHMRTLEASTAVKTITRELLTALFFRAAIRPTGGEFVAAGGPKPRAVDAARNAWTRERAQWAAVFLSAPRGRSERHGPSPATQLPRGTWAHRVSPNYGQRIAGSASGHSQLRQKIRERRGKATRSVNSWASSGAEGRSAQIGATRHFDQLPPGTYKRLERRAPANDLAPPETSRRPSLCRKAACLAKAASLALEVNPGDRARNVLESALQRPAWTGALANSSDHQTATRDLRPRFSRRDSQRLPRGPRRTGRLDCGGSQESSARAATGFPLRSTPRRHREALFVNWRFYLGEQARMFPARLQTR